MNDSPNQRKKRYSGLRRSVTRYNASPHWDQVSFEDLIRRFSCQLESEQTDHEKANAIYKEMMKELVLLTGHVSCSGKCRKRKKKARKETTVCKLEKSLAIIQRRINRLQDESSANTWDVRDARDGKCLKLHGMQKKALRLTKKINELSKLASANSNSNLTTSKIENTNEASGSGDGGSGSNSNNDMEELNCLLKSVRLKRSVKCKPTLFRSVRPSSECRSIYPRIEMVEIKKFDQQNQCYVEPSTKKPSSKPMPFKIIRQKGANVSNSTLSSSYQESSPCSTSDIKSSDLRAINNTKSPRSEVHKLRKQSKFDLICDRFRHVTLNS